MTRNYVRAIRNDTQMCRAFLKSRAYGDSESPNQTARMRSLIRAFVVRLQNHWALLNVSMESKCPNEILRVYCTLRKHAY